MAVIKKNEVAKPVLPKETVPMPSLNGDVVITGLLLQDRVDLLAKPGGASVSDWLSATVMDSEGLPVFSREEWETHGSKHFVECVDLFKVAKRLSGMNVEVAEKNS